MAAETSPAVPPSGTSATPKLFGMPWYIPVGGGAALLLVAYLYMRSKSSSSSGSSGSSMKVTATPPRADNETLNLPGGVAYAGPGWGVEQLSQQNYVSVQDAEGDIVSGPATPVEAILSMIYGAGSGQSQSQPSVLGNQTTTSGAAPQSGTSGTIGGVGTTYPTHAFGTPSSNNPGDLIVRNGQTRLTSSGFDLNHPCGCGGNVNGFWNVRTGTCGMCGQLQAPTQQAWTT